MSDLTLVMADVTRHKRTKTPIYDGTARTIGSGWHDSMSSPFYAFSSSGAIDRTLKDEIRKKIAYVKANPDHFDADETVMDLGTAKQNTAQLRALLDYVTKARIRGPVDGWSRVWVAKLAPEDEYNSDDA